MDFSSLLHGFVIIDAWISLCYYMDLSKFLHVPIKVFFYVFSPFAKQNQAKV